MMASILWLNCHTLPVYLKFIITTLKEQYKIQKGREVTCKSSLWK